MDWIWTPYAIVMFITAGITGAVGIMAFQYRQTRGSRIMALLLFALTEWAWATGLAYMALGVPAKIFWSKIGYLGVCYAPLFFLIFAMEYTHQDQWLTRRCVALLSIVPTIILLLALTNEWHALIWTSFTPGDAGNNLIVFGHGIGLWLGAAYFYTLILTGLATLVRFGVRHSSLYRQQAVIILLASLIPLVGNLIQMLDLSPAPGLNLSLISLVITAILLAANMLYFRMFDVMPIARDTLIEKMTDGVMVLDRQNRVVDMNPAGLRLLGRASSAVIGQSAQTALAPWRQWVERFIDTPQTQSECMTQDTPPRYIDLRITSIWDWRQRMSGRLVVMRDVTGLKQTEQTLRQRIEELTTLSSITQTLTAQTDLAAMIESAGDQLRQIKQAHTVFISIYDPQTQMIHTPYWRLHHEMIPIQPIPLGKGLVSHLIRTRQPLLINQDYPRRSQELGVVRVPQAQGMDLPKSWLGVPMIVGDQVIGAIGVHNMDREHAFTENDVRFWTLLASTVGAAIRNAQLLAETQRSAEQMAALNRISLAITDGLGLNRLLPTLHEQCRQIAAVDAFSVTLYDKTTELLLPVYFWKNGKLLQLPPNHTKTRPGFTGYIIQTRQSLYLADALDPNHPPPVSIIRVEGEPTRTILGVPLIVGNQVVGVIAIQSNQPHAFTPQQIRMFEMFTVQAAIAVQNSQLYEQVQNMAITDELTGLPNRRVLFEKGESEIARALRFGHPLAVMMVDIDHFKEVNDRFGHSIGDQVLRQMANAFREKLRVTDTAARYGGEEFVVLLPETDDQTARLTAERLRTYIPHMIAEKEQLPTVTISLGIAMLDQDTHDFSKLVAHADQALYESKNSGRNRTTVWNSPTRHPQPNDA